LKSVDGWIMVKVLGVSKLVRTSRCNDEMTPGTTAQGWVVCTHDSSLKGGTKKSDGGSQRRRLLLHLYTVGQESTRSSPMGKGCHWEGLDSGGQGGRGGGGHGLREIR